MKIRIYNTIYSRWDDFYIHLIPTVVIGCYYKKVPKIYISWLLWEVEIYWGGDEI